MDRVNAKRTVTLLSKEQAEVGHRFRVVNIPDECKTCRLFPVCLGRLTVGRSYRVVEVRPSMGQRCKITDGEMVPVVVEESPIVGLLPLNKAHASAKPACASLFVVWLYEMSSFDDLQRPDKTRCAHSTVFRND